MNKAQSSTLGILLLIPPNHERFEECVATLTAYATMKTCYVYGLYEGVRAWEVEQLRALPLLGMRLFACAYAARQRNLPTHEELLYCGLGMLREVLSDTDGFLALDARTGPWLVSSPPTHLHFTGFPPHPPARIEEMKRVLEGLPAAGWKGTISLSNEGSPAADAYTIWFP